MFNKRSLRIKAMQYLHAYFSKKSASSDDKGEKEKTLAGLDEEIAKIQAAHVQALHLLLHWQKIDREEARTMVPVRQEHLGCSQLLHELVKSSIWKKLSKRYPSWWKEGGEAALGYYEGGKRALLRTIDDTGGYEDEAVLLALVRIAFKQPIIQEIMGTYDFAWHDNKLIVRRNVLQTIKLLATPHGTEEAFALHTHSDISKEKHFYKDLVACVLEHDATYEALLATHLEKWRVERLYALDLLFIKMLLTEVYHMPDVPTSVAIHEYLEMAKQYSSSSSAAFIHGVVDAVLNKSTTKAKTPKE